MGSLWIVLSEMLQNGYNVIAQDVDIVWLRDPRPALSHSHGAPVTSNAHLVTTVRFACARALNGRDVLGWGLRLS